MMRIGYRKSLKRPRANQLHGVQFSVLMLFSVFMSIQSSIVYAQSGERNIYQKLNTPFYDDTIACDPGSGSAPSTTASAAGSKVYVVGDSITVGMRSAGLEQKFKDINYEVTGIQATVGIGITPSVAKVEADKEKVALASKVVVALGTNDANGATAATITPKIKQMIDKIKGISGTAQIYWVNIYSTKFSTEVINRVIQNQSGPLGYKVIGWNDEVNNNQDAYSFDASLGVHLQGDGYGKMASFIVGAVSDASTPAATATAGGCCAPGGSATVLSGGSNEVKVWNYLIGKGLTPPQVAGMMGNMKHEAGFEPRRTEYAYSSPPHLSDTVPPNVNSKGQPGYGIVQWTSPGRKQGLKDLSAQRGIIAGDLGLQLDYLWQELNGSYKSSVLDPIKASSSLEESTNIFLERFEVPANIPGTRPGRIASAQEFLEKFGSGTPASSGSPSAPAGAGCTGGATGPIDTAGCNVNAPVWGSQNGSGSQYSQEDLTRLFGNPGTAASHPEIASKLVNVDFLGRNVQIHQLAAGCLRAVANEIKAVGVNYQIREMGCYRYDSDNGSTNIGLRSYHTYGVACDINWSTNPFVSGGRSAPHDMPPQYVTAFRNHGFTWGGYWSSVKDYMHFEFNGIRP